MSEKRFELVSVCGDFGIIDTITDDVWFFETYETVVKVVDLLNEQQARIKEIEKENEQLKKARDKSDTFIGKKGLGAEFLEWCVANE